MNLSEEDKFELLLTQHLDGTLRAEDRSALENRLAEDESARDLLRAHQQIDVLLRDHLPVLPDVRWEALASNISAAIDAQDEAENYRMPWVGRVRWLAAAACVLLAVGLTIWSVSSRLPSGRNLVAVGPAARSIADVRITVAEAAAGAPVSHIEIGPAAGSVGSGITSAEQAIVNLPSNVIIASGPQTAQDAGMLPY